MYAALPPSMAVSSSVNVSAHCALSTVGNTCPHSKVMALVCLGSEVKEDLRFIIVSGPLGELQAYQAYHSWFFCLLMQLVGARAAACHNSNLRPCSAAARALGSYLQRRFPQATAAASVDGARMQRKNLTRQFDESAQGIWEVGLLSLRWCYMVLNDLQNLPFLPWDTYINGLV